MIDITQDPKYVDDLMYEMELSEDMTFYNIVKNDVVTVTDLSGRKVNYYVYEYGVVDKNSASYLAQPDNKNEKIVTLVTCTKGGKERYYVKARAK